LSHFLINIVVINCSWRVLPFSLILGNEHSAIKISSFPLQFSFSLSFSQSMISVYGTWKPTGQNKLLKKRVRFCTLRSFDTLIEFSSSDFFSANKSTMPLWRNFLWSLFIHEEFLDWIHPLHFSRPQLIYVFLE
jgi:hypothetical protein